MFKTLGVAITAMVISLTTQASCKVDHYEFSVDISPVTFDASYDQDDADIPLANGDYAEVKNLADGSVTRFDIGSFSNDGAGNFEFKGISSAQATYFEVYHDHETWDSGLEGYFTTATGSIIDLSSVKDCSFDDLFI